MTHIRKLKEVPRENAIATQKNKSGETRGRTKQNKKYKKKIIKNKMKRERQIDKDMNVRHKENMSNQRESMRKRAMSE